MTDSAVFAAWVIELMKAENLGVREFARRVGVSHPTISDVISGMTPSLKTCKAIADYTKMPLSVVLKKAGIMNEAKMDDASHQELAHIFESMNDVNRGDLIDYARMKLDKQKREEKDSEKKRERSH